METNPTSEMRIPCWDDAGTWGNGSCDKLDEHAHCANCPTYLAQGRELLETEPPKQYADEWTELLAKEKEPQPVDVISVLVFRVRGEWLAIRTECVDRVLSPRTIHSVPHKSGRVLLGLANVEGELLLCASLDGVMDLAQQDQASRRNFERMIVIGDGSGRWAIPVDEVHAMHRLPSSELQPAPVTLTKAPSAFSTGIFDLEGRSVALLDERLLLGAFGRALK